jgi:hypothetical protein
MTDSHTRRIGSRGPVNRGVHVRSASLVLGSLTSPLLHCTWLRQLFNPRIPQIATGCFDADLVAKTGWDPGSAVLADLGDVGLWGAGTRPRYGLNLLPWL